MTEKHLGKVLAELYPTTQEGPGWTGKRGVKAREKSRETIRELFLRGDTQGNSPGSKWSAYNAITEYHQHDKLVRTQDPQLAAERRFIRSFEDPEGFQKRALALVTA